MHKVFISGSMSIKNIDDLVVDKIKNIVKKQYEIIVGDADGVDSSIQNILKDMHSEHVIVYCASDKPRNNIGNWIVEKIQTTEKPGTREFFTAKDIKMAENCDYGLMVWDTKSTGTLKNVIELLKRNKISLIYINKAKEFLKIKEPNDLENLLSYMSESAVLKADAKLKIKNQIDLLKNKQSSLF